MGDFKKLDVWQRAHALGLAVYRACASFPRSEQYGLASQMRTAVVSIAANVVEGSGRLGHREFQRFLRISLGSAAKLECYLLLGHDLQFLDDASFGTRYPIARSARNAGETTAHSIPGRCTNLRS